MAGQGMVWLDGTRGRFRVSGAFQLVGVCPSVVQRDGVGVLPSPDSSMLDARALPFLKHRIQAVHRHVQARPSSNCSSLAANATIGRGGASSNILKVWHFLEARYNIAQVWANTDRLREEPFKTGSRRVTRFCVHVGSTITHFCETNLCLRGYCR